MPFLPPADAESHRDVPEDVHVRIDPVIQVILDLDREEEEESRIALRVAPLDESPEEAAAGDAVTDLTRVAPVNEAADRVKQSRQGTRNYVVL
ncbi:hypothetical protein Q1695_006149 [Nippostrongylus brasiliensis]|nr:hypothetical protein Q1695_006149 [Nippostrongylus brasiliensis]